MFKIIPILVIDTSKLDPPYDKNGSVTPVTGINPITTMRFNIVWKAILNDIPKDKNLAKLSSFMSEIDIPCLIMFINSNETINTPAKPSSSLIIENIKSVCGSGR